MVQDKIADMLTRIRNANQMRYEKVTVIGTKMTLGIAEILKVILLNITMKNVSLVINLL